MPSLRIARAELEGKGNPKNMANAHLSSAPTWTWAIALDGGTTNTRARLMCGREPVKVARCAVGVRDTVLSDKSSHREIERPSSSPELPRERQALLWAVRTVLKDVTQSGAPAEASPETGSLPGPELVAAAGMLCSEMGLVVVPHVPAPAGLDDLARGVVVARLPQIASCPFYFIPGIRSPAAGGEDGWFQSDVMRGEESETWGAYSELVGRGELDVGKTQVFLWPGSHTKLVEVAPGGVIARSQTSLAGEMIQAVAYHTLLAASLPRELPDEINWDAAAAGRRAVERQGVGRAAFLVRIAALMQTLDAHARASFWLGAMAADDVAHLVRHPILTSGQTVWVGGRQPLRSLYTAWLGSFYAGCVVAIEDALAASASALGALEIACRRRLFDRDAARTDAG
jgi:2-dehydro-3-deoxygalactonokinase